MAHSTIVGGSTAKRVINCPGSVALAAKMPPSPSSSYADEGTMLHTVISDLVMGETVTNYLGYKYEQQEVTQDLIDEKILPALAALDEIDPDKSMQIEVETTVNFGKKLPGVFGSADVIGRKGDRAYIIDWKFGSGVAVSAEENEQLMFYAAAARHTPQAAWAFDGATELELIIIQPPEVKRWATTFDRIDLFEKQLFRAVRAAKKPDAKLAVGDHCRWCPAKPTCPMMTGAADRAIAIQVKSLNANMIGAYLKNADLLEGWIKDLRALAFDMMEKDTKVPGWKLVAKRGTRKWANVDAAAAALKLLGVDPYKTEIISPAQAEKLVKELPDGLAVSVSSGSTLAEESDPRPAVLQIGRQMTAALSKLV